MDRSKTLIMTKLVTAGVLTCSLFSVLSGGNASASGGPKKTLEWIETQGGIPYYNPLNVGFKLEAKKLGFNVVVASPSTATESSQIPYIQQAIVKHVAGIAIQPNSATALLAVFRKAKAAGIKIVETDSDSLAKSVRVAGVTSVNYALVGPSQLAEVGQLMNYTGDFAIVSALSTSVAQSSWVVQIQNLLKTDPKYANMTLVDVVYGNDVTATDVSVTKALLTQFPNLKAILSPTTVGLAGVSQAVDSAGMGGKIIVTGLGEPIEMKQYILNKTVSQYQLWNVESMGIVSAYVLAQSLTGRKFSAGTRFQVPGSGLGTLKVNPGGGIYCQSKLTTFDLANVNQFNF